MSKKKELATEFKIKGIELVDSCLNAPKRPLPPNPVFQFKIDLENRINPEKNLLIINCSISIFTEDESELLGQLKVSCIYEVPNLQEFLNKDSSEFELPEDFTTTLNSISVSTTRGIMFTFFRGTFLHNAILPVIDPKSFKFNSEK